MCVCYWVLSIQSFIHLYTLTTKQLCQIVLFVLKLPHQKWGAAVSNMRSGRVRKDAILRGERRAWQRNGMSRWKSRWKRRASRSVLTRCSTLPVPSVVHFQARRETGRCQASGHIFSPVSTVRKNSHKMWCCLVLVPQFAAVITSGDRLDLQTSVLLILSITWNPHSKESLDFRQRHWHLLILSSVAFLCLPPSEAWLQHSWAIFCQLFFTWMHDMSPAGCLLSFFDFLVSWLQFLLIQPCSVC